MTSFRSAQVARVGTIAITSVLALSALAACGSSSKPASSGAGTYRRPRARRACSSSARSTGTPASTRRSSRRWTRRAPATGSSSRPATTTRPPTRPARRPSTSSSGGFGGVYIDKSNLHLRGMNRNSVIVDGTKPGAPACSASPADQTYGRVGTDGKPDGRNGILVWKANGVSVDNLTVCNFLAGDRAVGQRDLVERRRRARARSACTATPGSYLTATSTFFGAEDTAAQYGIFSSNSAGPGHVDDHATRATSTTPACTSARASRCATSRSTTPGWSTTRSATRAPTPAARS